jgi:hypothetical protein
MTSCGNLSKKNSKKIENPRLYMQNRLVFLGPYPSFLWQILATWQHIGTPQKTQEN